MSTPGGSLFDVQVTALRLEAEGVVSLELQAPDRAALPAWGPGAHVDLLLPSGTLRQYSLCGDPDDRRRLRLAVLLEPQGRGGSREVHQLRCGQRLQVRGPRNAFVLAPAPAYQFVAGGIGITPILAMARAAQRAGVPWRLVYGGRSRASMAFVDELHRLGGDAVTLVQADEQGPLDLQRLVATAAQGVPTYACGPGGLLDALGSCFAAAGLGAQLHVERFAPPAPPRPAAGTAPLQVRLARSGTVVPVLPEQSILAALRSAGHTVPSSCEQGICGQCETRVLDGVPEHHDQLLTDGERARGDVMMLCVSRACTPTLTLDL